MKVLGFLDSKTLEGREVSTLLQNQKELWEREPSSEGFPSYSL